MGIGVIRIILLFKLCLIMVIRLSYALVVLEGGDFQHTFEDIEASLAPPVKSGGVSGKLLIADPLDACSPLTNKFDHGGNHTSMFALIIRGGCSFEQKIRKAQMAGFKAAIVYDNEVGGSLVAMAGNSAGIKIHAIFVSKPTGETLKTFAGRDVKVWIIHSYDSSAWSIMAISFISLLAMSAVLATCFFVRRHRVRRERPQTRVREYHGMSGRLVKAMPSLVFTTVTEEYCTSSTCAICLEDYIVGDRLRLLPCRHKFHAICVDSWLTSWRTFCPVCKRDARTSNGEPPASESTPLLSSNPSSIASSPSSSFMSRSSAIQIASPSPQSHLLSRNHSILSSPQIPRPLRSPYRHQHSPSMSLSRSSMDLRNMSSQRSLASQLMSPHSIGYPSTSPYHSRYMSPYVPSPSNASSSYLGSSLRQPNALHYSESATSFSPYTSAQSLPGCD
ncbi:receptor homology region, transmembrane domain- and RING domain-containing protein 2-like [Silene latifolia]|uniref:receptor homology region, transmembrane domain- and RING domain-containing protein 2-like n=1 Tax=Silene latifolia TaxID=37657 RepID=UPI003D786BA7